MQAVCLDNDVLTMTGLSTVLTTDGVRGENIIREYDEGMTITLRRPVRDILGAMPGIEVSIDVPSIKATLSDHQYRLITSIAQDNLREPLALPLAAQWMKSYLAGPDAGAAPPPSGALPPAGDISQALEGVAAEPSLADKPASEPTQPVPKPAAPGGDRAARTSIRVLVNLGRAELEMLRTVVATGELAPLARFSVVGAWVAYRSTYGGSMFVSLSLPRVEGTDARAWVPEEHSLVICSAHASAGGAGEASAADGDGGSIVKPTFLTLQYEAHDRMAQQKLQVRLQRPTVVGEIGFMLAVTKFYVPDFKLSGVTPIPFKSGDVLLQGAFTCTPFVTRFLVSSSLGVSSSSVSCLALLLRALCTTHSLVWDPDISMKGGGYTIHQNYYVLLPRSS